MNSDKITDKTVWKIVLYLTFLSSEFTDTVFVKFIISSHVITKPTKIVDMKSLKFIISSHTIFSKFTKGNDFAPFLSIITASKKIRNNLYHYSYFEYYRSLIYYGKHLNEFGKIKNKLRTVYPKSHENFKNNKPRTQFYRFL